MNPNCPLCQLNDMFAKIGVLVCNAANFEGYLAPALATMIGDNGDRASVILGQIDSFTYKWSTVFGIAETCPENRCAKAILDMNHDIKAATAFRNRLAHGVTRPHGNELWLISNATSTKRGSPSGERLTPDEIVKHTVSFKSGMDALFNAVNWDTVTSSKGLMRAFRYTTGPSTGDPIPP